MDAVAFGPSAHAARTPDKAAFIENGLITTFVDFDARTDLLAVGSRARRRRRRPGRDHAPELGRVLRGVGGGLELRGSVVLVNTH